MTANRPKKKDSASLGPMWGVASKLEEAMARKRVASVIFLRLRSEPISGKGRLTRE